jgi:signal transduction histidine kinase
VSPGGLTLDIQDDGRGFDINQVASGNLGLEIMHERAKHIAARLTVTSQPGQGTQVTLCWPADSFQE